MSPASPDLPAFDLPGIAARFFDALVKENKPNYPKKPHAAIGDNQYCFGMIKSIIADVERAVTTPSAILFSNEFVGETRETLKGLRDLDFASQGLLHEDGDMFNNILLRISPKGGAEQREAMTWRIRQANKITTPGKDNESQYRLAALEFDLAHQNFADLADQLTVHSEHHKSSGLKDKGWGYR